MKYCAVGGKEWACRMPVLPGGLFCALHSKACHRPRKKRVCRLCCTSGHDARNCVLRPGIRADVAKIVGGMPRGEAKP